MTHQPATTAREKARKPKQSEAAMLRKRFADLFDWLLEQPRTNIFILPMPPNMANMHANWQVRASARTEYFRECDILRIEQITPEVWDVRPNVVQITVTAFVTREHDWDNLTARLKFALDWLKEAGYIRDDKPAHLTWAGMPTQQKAGKTPPRLEIELTAVARAGEGRE